MLWWKMGVISAAEGVSHGESKGCGVLTVHCEAEKGQGLWIVFQHGIGGWFLPRDGKRCEVDETCRRTQSKPIAQETHFLLPESEQLCTTLSLSIPRQVSYCQPFLPAPPCRPGASMCTSVSRTWVCLWQWCSPKWPILQRPGKGSTGQSIKMWACKWKE